MRKPISWNKLWMDMALLVAQRSKDEQTQVGAVAVSPDNKNIHIAYNGFPIKIKDTEERWIKPTKYSYVLHCETNLILNAKESLDSWSVFITIPPCPECTKLLIQSGIKRIVYHHEHQNNTKFDYSFSKELLKEAGIEIIKFEEKV